MLILNSEYGHIIENLRLCYLQFFLRHVTNDNPEWIHIDLSISDSHLAPYFEKNNLSLLKRILNAINCKHPSFNISMLLKLISFKKSYSNHMFFITLKINHNLPLALTFHASFLIFYFNHQIYSISLFNVSNWKAFELNCYHESLKFVHVAIILTRKGNTLSLQFV